MNVFVPAIAPPPLEALRTLRRLLTEHRTVVLTGAGCSTESGIPDYRSPRTPRRARGPMRYIEFVRQPEGRRRYWARSFAGWPRMRAAQPNAAHHALSALEARDLITGVITQNVDGLHGDAGSRSVLELHGSLRRVRCLECGELSDREALQRRLAELNGPWLSDAITHFADGDVDLPDEVAEQFVMASCQTCGGTLKPHVVFFGENVPPPRVDEAFAMLDAADALLVVGSSLTVFSGYRFALAAKDRGIPLVILNAGPTRADDLATLKVEAVVGQVLPRLAATRLD